MKYFVLLFLLFCFFSCASTKPSPMLKLISSELSAHPGAGIEDIYKLLYQGEFGVGHIISSREDASAYLNEEISSMPRFAGEPLWEPCSDDGSMIRVNLRPFVERKYSVEDLVNAMMETAAKVKGDRMRFEANWSLVRGLIEQGSLEIPPAAFEKFTQEIKAKNFPYIHHSKIYEERYKPAYRVVLRSAFEKYFTEVN